MFYKFKTKPYAHQLKALEMSWNKEVFAYFMEMGTGKSKVLLDNAAMLFDKGKIDSVLIVAPKGVYKNWFDSEIPEHLPEHINRNVVLWKSLVTRQQKLKCDSLFDRDFTKIQILLMNVEALSTKKGFDFARQFLNAKRVLFAVDESTTIKNPGAKRTKNILQLSKLSKCRRILTGSPVTKSPLDLYTQCFFLDPYLLDFTSYYAFRNRYAEMRAANFGGRSIQIVSGYKNLAELAETLKSFSYRVLKDDCLDLPSKTYMKRVIQLTPEQKRVYQQMKSMALAELKGKMITTVNVITQLMRLQQITCGHFKADDGSMQDIKNNRIDELMDVLEELEGKAIIWAHWRHDIDMIVREIEKEYPGSVVTYYGGTTVEDRQKAIKEIQNPESKIRFLVGTPQTAGYGITLTGASTMIYYSNGYDLEKRQQSEARIDRIGQEKPMTYIDILAEDTIDEKIVKSLRKKVNIATEIMGEELKAWI